MSSAQARYVMIARIATSTARMSLRASFIAVRLAGRRKTTQAQSFDEPCYALSGQQALPGRAGSQRQAKAWTVAADVLQAPPVHRPRLRSALLVASLAVGVACGGGGKI